MNIFVAIALLIASYVITALTTKPPQVNPPALFSDFQFPQPDEGTPQSVIFGDVWITDWFVSWYGNYQTIPIKAKGGK